MAWFRFTTRSEQSADQHRRRKRECSEQKFAFLARRVREVVHDARSLTLHTPPAPMVYLPIHVKSDTGMRGYYMEARVSGDPAALVGAVRDAVRRAEPPLLTNERSAAQSHVVRDHFS